MILTASFVKTHQSPASVSCTWYQFSAVLRFIRSDVLPVVLEEQIDGTSLVETLSTESRSRRTGFQVKRTGYFQLIISSRLNKLDLFWITPKNAQMLAQSIHHSELSNLIAWAGLPCESITIHWLEFTGLIGKAYAVWMLELRPFVGSNPAMAKQVSHLDRFYLGHIYQSNLRKQSCPVNSSWWI